ncbi:hypothetical protein BZG36_01979 [Bifiguratus adelaidae]|uniref:DUF1343 domain-containing protein n=1 Tax=Bifiguratus adelaidae TaxID=1938954 RepID=A0A261Y438_9FUNG|nr:hypothetical protein BZG36_01979 [Bifiguratus adelaidae]
MKLTFGVSSALVGVLAIVSTVFARPAGKVQSGFDVLASANYQQLKGLGKVGIITNPTAVNHEYVHEVDIMAADKNIDLIAIFGPEHGFRGTAQAGGSQGYYIDNATNLPVYDIYNKNNQSLADVFTQSKVDTIMYDIQNVDARFYTYTWTLYDSMAAAATLNKTFVILDRPSPIQNTPVRGPVMQKGYESFVGRREIAQESGMSLGELGLMFNKEFLPTDPFAQRSVDLKVIKLKGYKRSMSFEDTGLPWVLPSPNMPTIDTAYVYPGQCYFEGTVLSEGRGTTKPFETVGAPWINGSLANALRKLNLPGVYFREAYFVPTFSKWANQTCGGVELHVYDRNTYDPITTALAIITTTKKLYPDEFAWLSQNNIDLLSGSDRVRLMLTAEQKEVNSSQIEDFSPEAKAPVNEKIESDAYNDWKLDEFVSYEENGATTPDSKEGEGETEIRTEEREGIFSYLELIHNTIPEIDDPDLPLFTFRTVVLGLEIYYFKPQVVIISPLFILIIGYILGNVMHRIIPRSRFSNPGPFNIKEHVVISITATSASASAFATELLAVMDLFYGTTVNVGVAIFLLLSSQLLGYGFAGALRSFLVYPRHTYFPTTFPSVVMYDALHRGNILNNKRLKVFWSLFCGIFTWNICFLGSLEYPSHVWQIQTRKFFTNVFGGAANNEDWNYLSGSMYLPLTTQLNMLIGFIGCYVLFTTVYYTNTWNAQSFPFLSQELYLWTPESSYWNYTIYNQSLILDSNNAINQTALQDYGLPWYSATYAFTLLFGNLGTTAAVTHVFLYHGKAIWGTIKALRKGKSHQGVNDIHYQMMLKYKEVPSWWYGIILLFSFGVGIGLIYAGHATLPWWGFIVALLVSAVMTLIMGLMYSTTGFLVTIQNFVQLIGGYLFKRQPVANMWFTLYGYNTVSQAISMVSDLKMGQYLKVPPRAIFTAQCVGTSVGALLNYVIMRSIVDNQREVLLSPSGSHIWSGQSPQSFNSQSITWGGLTSEHFSPGKVYYPVAWSFLVGFLCPIPLYLLHKKFPNAGFNSINISVILWYFGDLCVGINSAVTTSMIIGFFFQFYVRKYRRR